MVVLIHGAGGMLTHEYPLGDNWMVLQEFIQIVDKDGNELAVYARSQVVAIRRMAGPV